MTGQTVWACPTLAFQSTPGTSMPGTRMPDTLTPDIIRMPASMTPDLKSTPDPGQMPAARASAWTGRAPLRRPEHAMTVPPAVSRM
jgi:hypothetical protein